MSNTEGKIFVFYQDFGRQKEVGAINRVQVKFNDKTNQYGLEVWRHGIPVDMTTELTKDEIEAVISCHQRLCEYMARKSD